jgi:hypothetical protein
VIEGIQLHLFADASNLACCAATVAVVEHKSGTVKGLLTSKSRISKKNTKIRNCEWSNGGEHGKEFIPCATAIAY